MKKSLVCVLSLLLCTGAMAQFFPKAGFSLATTSSDFQNLDPETTVKEKLRPGFLVGLGYGISLGNLTIQPELLFIQKGSTVEFNSVLDPQAPWTIRSEFDIALHYLELPVMIRYNFGGDALKFYAGAAPSLAMGLGGKGKLSATENYFGSISNDNYDFDVKFEKEPEGYEGNDLYIENKTEVSAQLSGGVIIGSKFMVDLRYGLGLTDWGNEEKTKNRAVQLSVAFLIGR